MPLPSGPRCAIAPIMRCSKLCAGMLVCGLPKYPAMPHMRVPSEASYEDVADETRPCFGGETGDEGVARGDGGDKLRIARMHDRGGAVEEDAPFAHQRRHD